MALYVSTFLVGPDLRLNLSSANQRVQDTSHVRANVCLCLSNNALADWSTQERFSEPVKYCLSPRCVRVMWKQGQLPDAARYVGVARDSRALQQEDSAGDGVKENRKSMDGVMAWTELESLIEPYYPKEGAGGHQWA